MRKLIGKTLHLLEPRARWQILALVGMMLVGAVLETIGVASVYATIAAIARPEQVEQQAAFGRLHQWLGEPSPEIFLTLVASAIVALFWLKNGYRALMYFQMHHFISGQRAWLSRHLFAQYLRSPYPFHLQRNSAELQRNVTAEVMQVMQGVCQPFLKIAAELLTMVAIVALLVRIEPLLTAIVASTLGLAIFGFQLLLRRAISRAGKRRQRLQRGIIQQISQSLASIKEIRVLGREEFFVDRYAREIVPLAKTQELVQTLSHLPQLYLETLTVTTVMGAAIAALWWPQGGDFVPKLSLLAVAAFRLKPSLNAIVGMANKIRYSAPAVRVVERELALLKDRSLPTPPAEPLPPLREAIAIENISYSYKNASEPALDGISLAWKRGESIALIGSSGAGKTTLVDVLLGLLAPQDGQILMDGIDIQTNLRSWQDRIGYVPQSIYLCDDTLRRNIAFGIPESEIDEHRLQQAVKSAQLARVVAELPDGLETLVGDRGVRISGGQRQRVGIARALYPDPSLLVLDEATAALDNTTEADLMSAIEQLSGEKTIVIIAHRLSTVKNCDRLYLLSKGRAIDSGTYAELLDRSPQFRDLARVT